MYQLVNIYIYVKMHGATIKTMDSMYGKTIQNTFEEDVLQYYLCICKHSDKIYTLCFNNHDCYVLHVLFSKHNWTEHCGQVFCTAASYPGRPTFECWHETQTNGILPKVRLLLLPSVSFPNPTNNLII